MELELIKIWKGKIFKNQIINKEGLSTYLWVLNIKILPLQIKKTREFDVIKNRHSIQEYR